ncbi:MAG: hypothetical protein ACOYT4_02695 [Nanoarchaeota archaeon]
MANIEKNLEKKHLIAGLFGLICPMPVFGEALLAYSLYPIEKEIFKEDTLTFFASFATSTLIRLPAYNRFYLPIISYCKIFMN